MGLTKPSRGRLLVFPVIDPYIYEKHRCVRDSYSHRSPGLTDAFFFRKVYGRFSLPVAKISHHIYTQRRNADASTTILRTTMIPFTFPAREPAVGPVSALTDGGGMVIPPGAFEGGCPSFPESFPSMPVMISFGICYFTNIPDDVTFFRLFGGGQAEPPAIHRGA